MVRFFLLFALLCSFSYANETKAPADTELLTKKIKNLVAPATFAKDRAFIDVIFSPKEAYFNADGTLNSIKVIQTLKENGILNLFFKQPRDISITFKTRGQAQFFVKVMSDSLQNIGYYKYVTSDSSLNDSEFIWKIGLTSEYAPDPLIINQELKKNSCEIIDIVRDNHTDWTYVVDMKNAKLNVPRLQNAEEFRLKRSLYASWIDVSKIASLSIESSVRNDWFPYIAYYDKNLNLLKVLKFDAKKTELMLDIEEKTHYLKISDMYTLKNIKDDLVLRPRAQKSE